MNKSTQNKTVKTVKTAKLDSMTPEQIATQEIEKAVTGLYSKKLTQLQVEKILFINNVAAGDLLKKIDDVAHKLKLILTDDEINSKVGDFIKDKKINHFLDVRQLASQLVMPQATTLEKEKAIIKNCKVESSKLAKHAKFNQFDKSGMLGQIMEWVLEHETFTAEQYFKETEPMRKSAATDMPNYQNEVLAYMEEMRDYFTKHGLHAGINSNPVSVEDNK